MGTPHGTVFCVATATHIDEELLTAGALVQLRVMRTGDEGKAGGCFRQSHRTHVVLIECTNQQGRHRALLHLLVGALAKRRDAIARPSRLAFRSISSTVC